MKEYNTDTQDFYFAKGLTSFSTEGFIDDSYSTYPLESAFREYQFEVDYICESKSTLYYRVPEHYSDIKIEWIGELIKYNSSTGVQIIVVRSDGHKETLREYYKMKFEIEDAVIGLLQKHEKVPYTEKGLF